MKNIFTSVDTGADNIVQKNSTTSLQKRIAQGVIVGLMAGAVAKNTEAGPITYTNGTPVIFAGTGYNVPGGILTDIVDSNTYYGQVGASFEGTLQPNSQQGNITTESFEGGIGRFFFEAIDSGTGELSTFAINLESSEYLGTEFGVETYRLWTFGGQDVVFSYRTTTNELFVGNGQNMIPFERVVTSVPEPGSLALLTGGLLGIFASLRKKKGEAK